MDLLEDERSDSCCPFRIENIILQLITTQLNFRSSISAQRHFLLFFNQHTTTHKLSTQLFLSSDHTQSNTVASMPGLTSASGVLGFLSEEEPELKIFALQTLNDDIDTLWTEVAGSLSMM